MLVLITYDVNTENAAGRKRLRQISKQCVNYGQRVQNSVFECLLDPAQCIALKQILRSIMDEKRDSLRFYYLGDKYASKIEHFGVRESYDPEGVLVVSAKLKLPSFSWQVRTAFCFIFVLWKCIIDPYKSET